MSELLRLDAQVRSQRLKAQGFGVEPPKAKSPSILGRVFDVLSRPNYAVSEFLTSGLKDRKEGHGGFLGLASVDDAFRGGWKGLQGKKKTSMSDYLKEQGMPGGWQRTVLGLGLDIVTDPTTYVGTGIIGKADDAAKFATKAMKVGELAVDAEKIASKAGEVTRIGSKVADAKKAAVAAERVKAGGKLSVEGLEKAVRAGDQVLADYGLDVAKTEQARLLATHQPAVALKIGGRPVIASKTLYGATAAVGDIIGSTPTGEAIAKAFRTTRAFPGKLNIVKAIHENESAVMLRDGLQGLKDTFKGTSKKQREELAHYIRTGTTHHDPAMQDLIEKSRSIFGDIADEERTVLGHVDSVADPNYLPTVYYKGNHLRTFDDVIEAERKGYKQVDDVATLLGWKIMSHRKEMAKMTMAEDVMKNFGFKVSGENTPITEAMAKGGALTNKVPNRYIPKNYYFDRDIADGVKKLFQVVDNDEDTRRFMQIFDRAQANWKWMVTAPWPGFHARNLMGDVWNNFLDGVVDPTIYGKASRVVSDHLGDVTFKVGSTILDKSELNRLYNAMGLRSGFLHSEVDVIPHGVGGALRSTKDAMTTLSEKREDFGRMAHFMSAMRDEAKNVPKNIAPESRLNWIADKAAERVRKFNFDYNDFTPFEKTKLRRAIPFYSWMRKNVPLQLEMLFTRPGRMAMAPKGLRAISSLMGVDPNDEPMPGLQNVIPQWLTETAAPLVGIGGPEKDPTYLNLAGPWQDMTKYIEGLDDAAAAIARKDFDAALSSVASGPGQEILSGVTPFVRTPFEMATGKQLFSGADIRDNSDYIISQFGPAGKFFVDSHRPPEAAQGVVELNIGGKKIRIPQSMFNNLTGLGVTKVTPNAMKGELRRQQDPLQSIIAEAKKRLQEQGNGR
jgi:hypothetical protein